MRYAQVFSAGLALFAMLFGAGNIVFPLALGRAMGDHIYWALIGFVITAVIVPIIGLVAVMLYNGNYKQFLGLLGPIPGFLIALVSLILIGPFGIIPRCVTVAYAAVQWYLPWLTLFMFSLIAAALIFVLTFRAQAVATIIARFLGPLKLVLLLSIIAFGVYWYATPPHVDQTPGASILNGFLEGYATLDLLGAIFFASLIVAGLKRSMHLERPKDLAIVGLQAGTIGGLLLGLVYLGFAVVAAMHGHSVANVDKSQLLTALASFILGEQAGILANITVAVACLTTSVALTTVFANYLRDELGKGRWPYLYCLIATICISTVMSNLGFTSIMTLIMPIVIACYPALIVLSLVAIAHKLWGWRWIKTPVALTFIATLFSQFMWH